MIVQERYRLPQETRQELRERAVEWGFGSLSEAVYFRTYSRMRDDGRQERWDDTVTRVVEGVMSIRQDWYKHVIGKRWSNKEADALARELAYAIHSMKFLPPGRGLWAMGTEYVYERGNMALINCGAVDVNGSLAQPARWAMDALMCGVGVGFTTNNSTIRMKRPGGEPRIYVIPDSKEGWAESVKRLIQSYERGGRPVAFDYSQIRRAGTAIRGFGGTSAGAGPLRTLHGRLEKYLEMWADGKISRTRLIADTFNAIGACVVAGNVRRSAELAVGAPDDAEFMQLKDYDLNPERAEIGWMSNNSVALSERDHFAVLPEIAERIATNGEPGILNLMNVQKYGRIGEKMNDDAVAVNPCVTGETLLAVADGRGAVRIDSLIGQDVPVFAMGEEGVQVAQGVHVRRTGSDQPVVRVELSDGTSFRVTPNHKFLLRGGRYQRADSLVPGEYVRQFTRTRARTGWQITRDNTKVEHRLIGRFLKHNDAVHHIDHDHLNNSWDNLAMVTTAEHTAYHMEGEANPRNRFTDEQKRRLNEARWAGPSGYPTPYSRGYEGSVFQTVDRECESCGTLFTVSVRKREVCFCSKSCWRSSVGRKPKQGYKRGPGVQVVSVEPDGTADVYNVTVEGDHNYAIAQEVDGELFGLFSRNCGEIPLETAETCNLVEVFPTRCDPSELGRILELATFYASTVALLRSHSEETNEVASRNRRIGVSVSGIADWLDSTSTSNVFDTLNRGYDVVRETNRRLARSAGVAESLRVTTVKPSGTVSLLAGVSSGMHHPLSGYVMRRVRVAQSSPVAEILDAAGVPHEPDVVSDNTEVFEFPLRYGNGRTRSVKTVSVFEQAATVAMLQRAWADNAVSATLTIQPDENRHVERVLSLFAPQVKSLSMLPDRSDVYAQMPIEHLTKEEYEKRQAALGDADWSTLHDSDGDASDAAYCSTDSCEVPQR